MGGSTTYNLRRIEDRTAILDEITVRIGIVKAKFQKIAEMQKQLDALKAQIAERKRFQQGSGY